MHLGDVLLILLLLAIDVVLHLLEGLDLLVLDLLLRLSQVVKGLRLSVHIPTDLIRDYSLGLDLFLQLLDLLLQFALNLVVLALLAGLFAVCLPVAILNVEFGLCLGLVDLLLQVKNLLVILQGFFSVLILSLFKVLIQFLNFKVQILFLLAESLELTLGIQTSLDVLLKLRVLEVSHLCHKRLQEIHQLNLILLNLLLVPLHVWVVLKLSAQSSGRFLQIFSHSLYFFN